MWSPKPAASASARNLWEIQILRLTPNLLNQKLWGRNQQSVVCQVSLTTGINKSFRQAPLIYNIVWGNKGVTPSNFFRKGELY